MLQVENQTYEKHPLAGKTVLIKQGDFKNNMITIEGRWNQVRSTSWERDNKNPTCVIYQVRRELLRSDEERNIKMPKDNEVLCGKMFNAEYLIHARELENPPVKKKDEPCHKNLNTQINIETSLI